MFPIRRLTRAALMLQAASQAVAATGGDVPTAAVTANPTLTAAADHVIGYAVESGNTYPALCYIDNTFTSVSGTIAACASTSGTVGVVGYQFCSGPSLYIAQVNAHAGTTRTTLDSISCDTPCSTATIYDAYPSATPTFHMGICGNGGEAAGVAPNLPPDVKVLYRHIPSGAAADTASASGSSSTGGSSNQAGNQNQSSSSKTPVIVGSVIGGVAGIGLVAGAVFLAFYCGRRRALKRNAANPPPMRQAPSGTADLDSQNIRRPELASVPVALSELQSEHTHELPASSQYVTELVGDPSPDKAPGNITNQNGEVLPPHITSHTGVEALLQSRKLLEQARQRLDGFITSRMKASQGAAVATAPPTYAQLAILLQGSGEIESKAKFLENDAPRPMAEALIAQYHQRATPAQLRPQHASCKDLYADTSGEMIYDRWWASPRLYERSSSDGARETMCYHWRYDHGEGQRGPSSYVVLSVSAAGIVQLSSAPPLSEFPATAEGFAALLEAIEKGWWPEPK